MNVCARKRRRNDDFMRERETENVNAIKYHPFKGVEGMCYSKKDGGEVLIL